MNRNQIRLLGLPVGQPDRGPAFGERLDPATFTFATIAPALFGSVAGAVVSSALSDSGGSAAVSAPAPVAAAPTVMPTPDDTAMKAAQRKLLAATQARRGRDSTILSDPASGDLLGG